MYVTGVCYSALYTSTLKAAEIIPNTQFFQKGNAKLLLSAKLTESMDPKQYRQVGSDS